MSELVELSTVAGEYGRLHDALDELARGTPDMCTDAELLEAWRALEIARRRLDAVEHALIAAVQFGLSLHPDKTRIVFCKQDRRSGDHPVTEFTFLGYTFRPRTVRTSGGRLFTGFAPAVSKAAKKHMARIIRGWRLGRCTGLAFTEIAAMINRVVAGWINYYGRFYKSLLISFLQDRINPHLARWAMRKYKHLHRQPAKARRRLAQIATTHRDLFIHWQHGALPTGSTTGAV